MVASARGATMVIGVFFWLALSIIVGVAANTRGRNPAGWFILSILFSPILAGLMVVALPNYNPQLTPTAPIHSKVALDERDDGSKWAGLMVVVIVSAMMIGFYIFGKAH